MFELYNDEARVVFFARYEASMLGSRCIDTEHLLLGMLRQCRPFLDRYLTGSEAVESIRAEILEHAPTQPTIPTSVDMPLTDALKRVLVAAAEEAERLHQRFVGPEHLCLGLLWEPESLASKLLLRAGVTAERIREDLAKPAEPSPSAQRVGGTLRTEPGRTSAPASFGYPLIAEDGSVLHDIRWHEGRLARIPLIGEALELNSNGEKKRYRVLDVIWQVRERFAGLFHDGDVLLQVRSEQPSLRQS